MSRRNGSRLLAAFLLVLLIAAATFAPVPYVSLSPGPTFDTLGSIDGIDLITVDGRETFDTDGQLDLTTVSERGEPRSTLYLGAALWGWLDPDVAIVPERLVNPDDLTEEQVREQSSQQMELSQENAVSAAIGYLDLPARTDVVVRAVQDGSPADGALQPADVVLEVDGAEVSDDEQVRDAVRAKPVGSTIAFTVLRGDEELDVEVTSEPRPDDPDVPYVGVTPGEVTRPDGFTVDIQIDNVGGPSAGLMFALGIVDKLTDDQLTGGRHVAGTGTIAASGEIGPIGGIQQKLVGARDAGASLFLAPIDNCDEVVGAVPDGLTVAAVRTLSEAVEAIEAVEAGRPVASCAVALNESSS